MTSSLRQSTRFLHNVRSACAKYLSKVQLLKSLEALALALALALTLTRHRLAGQHEGSSTDLVRVRVRVKVRVRVRVSVRVRVRLLDGPAEVAARDRVAGETHLQRQRKARARRAPLLRHLRACVDNSRPKASANSRSSTPRQRQIKSRAASSLGQAGHAGQAGHTGLGFPQSCVPGSRPTSSLSRQEDPWSCALVHASDQNEEPPAVAARPGAGWLGATSAGIARRCPSM